MSKLAEYMRVLAEEPTEYAGWRANGDEAMTRFGLSEDERYAVLRGDPATVRAVIARAEGPSSEKPKPIPLQTDPKPKPK